MVFSLQYASDLHLEMMKTIPDDLIYPSAPYIAFCGDIGCPFKNHYYDFLADMSKKFKKVFVIAGNHEMYRNQIDATINKINQIVNMFDNVYFLNNNVYQIDGVKIIGSTLWSNIDDNLSNYINDFFLIETSPCEYLTTDKYRQFHKEAVEFIDFQINLDELPKIVLTHHAIHIKMNGKYIGNKLESAFATDLKHLCRPPVKCFISGHTHQNVDMKYNSIPIKSNCYGYNKDEQSSYQNNKVFNLIELDN